jgi:hypothetical protein
MGLVFGLGLTPEKVGLVFGLGRTPGEPNILPNSGPSNASLFMKGIRPTGEGDLNARKAIRFCRAILGDREVYQCILDFRPSLSQ